MAMAMTTVLRGLLQNEYAAIQSDVTSLSADAHEKQKSIVQVSGATEQLSIIAEQHRAAAEANEAEIAALKV
jgi:hypothetical protein